MTAPPPFQRRPCDVCGQEAAHRHGRPVYTHRIGKRHQAALSAARKERERKAVRA